MITPDEWKERKKQWEIFNLWKSRQAPVDRDPADVIADIGAIVDWLPPEALAEDADPEKRGIQKLRAVLERLNARR
jgi:hypothetical protein